MFGCYVNDPERFGVVEFDADMNAVSIEEKPKKPKSNYAVVGLYFYDGKACGLAKTLVPSKRGELEITDLNIKYMEEGRLKVKLLGKEVRWLDAGTFDSLLEAGNFIKDVQTRTAKNVGCPEEIALKSGFVTKEEVIERISKFKDNSYQIYVKEICGIKTPIKNIQS